MARGLIAHLVERHIRIVEVEGSNPFESTGDGRRVAEMFHIIRYGPVG